MGVISRVAGTGIMGNSGDDGPATYAELTGPYGVAVTADGGFLIADTHNNVVRKVSSAGVITRVAGTGAEGNFFGDDGPATVAELNFPVCVAVTADGGFLIADSFNHMVRKVSSAGVITRVAGTGTAGNSGDDGPATVAELTDPRLSGHESRSCRVIIPRATSSIVTATPHVCESSSAIKTRICTAPAWVADPVLSSTPTKAPGSVTRPTVRVVSRLGSKALVADCAMISIRESRSLKPRLSAASTSPARSFNVSNASRAATATAVMVFRARWRRSPRPPRRSEVRRRTAAAVVVRRPSRVPVTPSIGQTHG